ncbi:hypothetical protein MW887_002141 [Aspergillus wentii]|nr:hypothetical protein MW887_002141 [Aspergillus wentii]
MSASTASASAANLPSDSRSGPFRRLSQLRTYTQNHFSPHSSSATTNSHRSSYLNTLSNRVSWLSPTSHASANSPESPSHSSPVGTTSDQSPCPESDRSALARYSSVFFSSYRSLEVDLYAQPSPSTSSDSSRSTPSSESGRSPMQGTMARLRRLSQTLEARSNMEAQSPVSASTNPQNGSLDSPEPVAVGNTSASPKPKQKATIRFFPHQDPHQSSRPSLHFIPVSRTLPSENSIIRVGRYSERDGVPVANPSEPSDAPVGFKSKVVSRRHCEFLYTNGQWHVKDVGSSSGTFLNHMRLSQPNMVSRLYTIKDGDIVQLGIDFRGGEEMIFRCVRIRIECNRSWQQQPNEFKCVLKPIHHEMMQKLTDSLAKIPKVSLEIWRPYQCLFMAACAHVWHYKCVSRLIHTPEYPMFQCPNCRAYTDLSAEVDDTNDFDTEEPKDTAEAAQQTPTPEEPQSHTPSLPLEDGHSSDGSPEPAQHGHQPNGHQSSELPEEAGLAVNIENLHIQDGSDTQGSGTSESPEPASAPNNEGTSNNDNVPRSSNIDIPGWQSVAQPTALQTRQAQLRSDTPVRSETSDDNPLTPRNDSGPLAFDGRAGMS